MKEAIKESEFIEYIREHKYIIFQNGEEHSIEGIIERFKDDK